MSDRHARQKPDSQSPKFNFDQLSKELAHDQKSWSLISPGYFYSSEIAGLREISEGYAWGYCPFCKEPEPSFCINLKTGGYKCMAPECREEGSSMLTFASNFLGLAHHEAIRYLDASQGEIA